MRVPIGTVVRACRGWTSTTVGSLSSKPVAMTVTLTVVAHVRVGDDAEDDVGLLVGGLLDEARRLVDLLEPDVGARGEVDEDPTRAVDADVVEERRVDGHLRGFDGAAVALGRSRCPSARDRWCS